MHGSRIRTTLFATVAAVAFVGSVQGNGISRAAAASAPASAGATTTASQPGTTPVRPGLPDFTALVEQVGPAVVNISVTSVEKNRFNEDDPFYDFFRRFGIPTPDMPGNGSGQPRVLQGIGSGFIVSQDGYVLTNAHVVKDAKDVTVKLTDKREFKAKVIGSDARTDVALIKINATNLPTVRMGDAEHAKVGEWVLAVGSPFGFENTVTAGIISAKARRLPDETFVPFIQTDVAINPGNSGGPLFNLNGEVIGINSQIYSRSGGFMGISFSIPIDVAMKVKDQLQKYGKVSRGKLGVVIQGMDKDLAQSFGLDKPTGALVSSVETGGPADKAGLQPGDIIQQVDGTRVDESTDLPRIIGDRRPGETVKLKIWRDKANRDISVKLAEQAADQADNARDDQGNSNGKIGLAVRPLRPQEARRAGVKEGLMIEGVSGAAERAGLQPGDIILLVNNQSVNSVEQFRKQVEAAGKRVPLLVQRDDMRQFIVIRLN